MSNVTVRLDPDPVIAAKLFYPGGGVDQDLRRRVRRVEAAAKIYCPVKTSALRSTIGISRNRDLLGRYSFGYQVSAGGPRAPYVLPVHQGARPHVIVPSIKSALAFTIDGRPVVTRRVNHPGNRAQPFLTLALSAAAG